MKDKKFRRDLTTGELAKHFGVAPRTVSKWADSGALKHYRLPCSADRRFLHKDVLKFLLHYKLPNDWLARISTTMVVVGSAQLYTTVVELMSIYRLDKLSVIAASDAFEAGRAAATDPVAAIVDSYIGSFEAQRVAKSFAEAGVEYVALLSPEDSQCELIGGVHIYNSPVNIAHVTYNIYNAVWNTGNEHVPSVRRLREIGEVLGQQTVREAASGSPTAPASFDRPQQIEPSCEEDVGGFHRSVG